MKPYRFVACASALLILTLAMPYHAQQVFDVNGNQKIRVVPIATGLVHPYSIAFLPDGKTMLVAEQPGRMRIIRDGVLDPKPVWTTSDSGADNLHFVAVHPKFIENHFVYFSYPKKGERGITLGVARGRLDGGTLTEIKDVFVADAWETGGNLAGRIMFGPDGSLYVTVGDRDRICCNGTDDNSLRLKAQDLKNDAGKVLRIRDDGSIPTDNPSVGRTDAKREIFTYGQRNTYCLALTPETRARWQA